jgi:hypothetical protein
MKAEDSWTTYRTRFLVKAKQLTTSLTFTDPLGREHSGQMGDYLVEFSDGVRRIASRQIFEDIYVPIMADQSQLASNSCNSMKPAARPHTERPNEDEQLFERESGKCLGENPAAITIPVHLARKAQQSVRGHRYPFAGSH